MKQAPENARTDGWLIAGKAAREVIFGRSCTNGNKDRTWVQGILSVDYIHMYFHCAFRE